MSFKSTTSDKLSKVGKEENDTDSEKSRSSSVCPVDSTTKFVAGGNKGRSRNFIPTHMCIILHVIITSIEGRVTSSLIMPSRAVHEAAIQQVTVKFNVIQVQLWASIMNWSPYHNGSCKSTQNTNYS